LEQNTIDTPEFVTSQVRITPKAIPHLALIFIKNRVNQKIKKLQKGEDI
jgi:hypothetical protein